MYVCVLCTKSCVKMRKLPSLYHHPYISQHTYIRCLYQHTYEYEDTQIRSLYADTYEYEDRELPV